MRLECVVGGCTGILDFEQRGVDVGALDRDGRPVDARECPSDVAPHLSPADVHDSAGGASDGAPSPEADAHRAADGPPGGVLLRAWGSGRHREGHADDLSHQLDGRAAAVAEGVTEGAPLAKMREAAQRAVAEGCSCGWGGQHRDSCAQGRYEAAVADPAWFLAATEGVRP